MKFRLSTNCLPHIVTTNIEHPAITKPLQQYEVEGLCSVTYVPVVKGKIRTQVFHKNVSQGCH